MVILAIAIFLWQLPTLLKALPSRYVAAYLPQPVQALAEREHVETLPTAAVAIDANTLLVIEGAPAEDTSVSEDPNTAGPDAGEIVSTPLTAAPGTTETPPATGLEAEAEPTRQPSPTPTNTPIPIPPTGRLDSLRHHFQTWNNCGPATLAMGLSYFDVLLSQEQTASILKPNPEDRNVSPYEMVAFVNQETGLQALERTNGNLDNLRRLIANGIPVIVELGIDPPGEYRWLGWYGHYLLVVAYDDDDQQFWVYDSWFGTSETPAKNADAEGRQISYEELDRYWRQFNRHYIILHSPEQEAKVAQIIGPDNDNEVMWQRSLVRTQKELAAEPEDAFLWFNLGTIFNELDQYDKAAAAFDQARAIGLPWRMLWYQFGPYEAYYEIGRHEDVILLADLTLKDRPYFEESYYYKGLAEAAMGDLKEARDLFEKAARFNPNFAPAVEALEQLGT
jgi:hypothetical protein